MYIGGTTEPFFMPTPEVQKIHNFMPDFEKVGKYL